MAERNGWVVRGTAMAVLVAGLAVSPSTGQGRGGGGGGNLPPGMQPGGDSQRRDMTEAMRAFPVAQMWAELSLAMELDEDKLREVKPLFVDAYTLRSSLLAEAREEATWAYAKAQMAKAERELWSKLSTAIPRKQLRSLERVARQR